MKKLLLRVGLILFAVSVLASAATLSVYLSPPGQMSSVIPGVVTEDFNAVALLTSSSTTYDSNIGIYTVPNGFRMPVIAADQYGGANNSQYMYVGSRHAGDATTVTLTLDVAANYFGFWWSAGDSKNRMTIYNNGTVLAVFQTSDITSLLANNPVVAINGTQYQTSAFKGNPNTGAFHGQDGSEPFSYVNLVALGVTFDKIVFDNNGSSGFENDNHSVYTGVVDIPRDFPSFAKVVDVPFVNDPVPEPGTGILLGGAFASLLVVRTSYRRVRRAQK